jgi:hypothetical protein
VKKLPRGYKNPLEASYRHLPVTPSHGELREVRGMVDEFIELNEKLCLPNALMRMESQEVKFDDFRSKCGIPGGTPKNNITGSCQY